MRVVVAACLLLFGCGTPSPGARSSATGGPAWATEPDRTEHGGNVFSCEAAGVSEEEAFTAAKQLCSDKLCKLCGVKIESRVEVKETFKGVDMQRKVVERCTRARTRELEIRYRQSACGPEGCRSWVQIFYSSADQEKECKRFSDDNFADPAKCQKLLQDFSRVPGLTSLAFERRHQLLLGAEAACAEIDVRPTPLMESLDEHLWIGIGQIAAEEPQVSVLGRCSTKLGPSVTCGDKTLSLRDYLVAVRRDQLDRVRADLANEYYTFPGRQTLKATPSFVTRLHIAIAWAAEHVKTYAAIDALTDPAVYTVMGDTYYTPAGLARIVATFRSAPKSALGTRDRPVHFWVAVFLFLAEKMPDYGAHSDFESPAYGDDNSALSQALREILPPEEAAALHVPDDVSRLFAMDDRIDEAEWKYTLAMHRASNGRYAHGCLDCLSFALRARNHGGFEIHKKRLLEALKDPVIQPLLAVAGSRVDQLFPEDGALIQAVWPDLPDAYRLSFDSLARLYDAKVAWLTREQRRWLVDQLEATLIPSNNRSEAECEKLPDRLQKLAALGREPSVDQTICTCLKLLSGPGASSSPFRQGWIDGFYRQQAGRGLDCLMQGSRR